MTGEREWGDRPLRALFSAVAFCLIALPLVWLGITAPAKPAAAAGSSWTAYVVLEGDNSVVPIDTGTNTAGTPISFSGVVSEPAGIAINPTATTAYVSNFSGDDVTPVDLTTGTREPFIALTGPASGAYGVALPPTGSATNVLLTNENAGAVDPVNPSNGEDGTPIPTGSLPTGIAITPDGSEAYVANNGGTTVTPIDLSTDTAGAGIGVGAGPIGIAVAPDGSHVYVANSAGFSVSVIATATNTVTATIPLGSPASAIAISPDGATAYVATSPNLISVIDTATDTVTGSVTVGNDPQALAVTPDGAELYVANFTDGTVSVIDTTTDTVSATIPVGTGSQPQAIAITPDQAPVASLSDPPAPAGSPTTFDASGSTVAYGTIASYAWDFGDGSHTVTASPSTSHVYASAGTYTATVTETSSGGTSTTPVFTGQTMLRNGGPSATASITVVVPPPVVPPAPPPAPPAPPPAPTTPAPATSVAPAGTTAPNIPIFLGSVSPGLPRATTLPIQQPSVGPTLPPTASPPTSTPGQRSHRPAPNPLTFVPVSGSPGLAVAVTDRRLPTTCSPDHTVYVFFDDQLVSQAQAVGRTFHDSDVVIPGDAGAGVHHFALSCSSVGTPIFASARFDVTISADHQMGWVTSLPRPGNLNTGATTFGASVGLAMALLALILVYLIGFPSKWFNSTYDANHERMMAAARRRFPRLMGARAAAKHYLGRRVAVPLIFLVFVALAALIHSSLDPKFGWNRSSLWLWLGWCCGVTVVALGFQLPAMLHGSRVRGTHEVELRILLGSFLVAVTCVVVSRLLTLQPGYCYGLLAVFAFRPTLPRQTKGRVAAASTLLVLGLSMAAWFIWVPLQRAASHPNPSPLVLVVEAFLGVVFILGIESVSFGMLPLPFLPGRDVWSWNRWVWGALFSLGTFGFVWILLQPGSGYANRVRHLDLIPVAVTCAAFAGATLAMMAYFKFRKPKLGIGDEPAAPVGLAD